MSGKSFNNTLEQAFLDLEQQLLECKSNTTAIANLCLTINSQTVKFHFETHYRMLKQQHVSCRR